MQQVDFLQWLHREIPLTAAMQIDAVEFDGKRLALRAPLAPNLNERGPGSPALPQVLQHSAVGV